MSEDWKESERNESDGDTLNIKAVLAGSVNGPISANVRVDGCVDLRRHYKVSDGAPPSEDYIHICDLDDFIEELEKLRDFAKANIWQGCQP
jgi:hypothetical protein